MVPIWHHELNYFTSIFWPKLIHGADMVPFRKTTNDRYFNSGSKSAPFHHFWFHHSITWTDMYIFVILTAYPSKSIGSETIWGVFLLAHHYGRVCPTTITETRTTWHCSAFDALKDVTLDERHHSAIGTQHLPVTLVKSSTIKWKMRLPRLFGCSCDCRLSTQEIPYIDLVHNEFRMRTLFLQTKIVVGRKRMVLGCCSSSTIFGDITVLIYH